MAFQTMPFLGQEIDLLVDGEKITGILHSISSSHCEIISAGSVKKYSNEAIISARFHFPSYLDAIHHLSFSGDSRHCPLCYVSYLYAVDLLGLNFKNQIFSSREDIIKRGIISFLQKDFPTSAYSLLPQVDGITTQVLNEDGLLKITEGFPKWTLEHPDSSLHNKSCSNILRALEGAESAKEKSRIQHITKWLGNEVLLEVKNLRNNLMHGSLLQIHEHQASMLILLIQALHHGVNNH